MLLRGDSRKVHQHRPETGVVLMTDFGDGTASGDYDNETAGLEEKLLQGKRARIDTDSSGDAVNDTSGRSLDDWELDGGRRSGD